MKLRHGAQAVGGSTYFYCASFLTEDRLKKGKLANVSFAYVCVRK